MKRIILNRMVGVEAGLRDTERSVQGLGAFEFEWREDCFECLNPKALNP